MESKLDSKLQSRLNLKSMIIARLGGVVGGRVVKRIAKNCQLAYNNKTWIPTYRNFGMALILQPWLEVLTLQTRTIITQITIQKSPPGCIRLSTKQINDGLNCIEHLSLFEKFSFQWNVNERNSSFSIFGCTWSFYIWAIE